MKIEIPDLPVELDRLLRQIPSGRIATYGDLAEALGYRQAARWVGEYLVAHAHDAACPCHRVVRSTGEPGLFITRRPGEKETLLQADGVPVHDGRVDLRRYRFDDFTTERPLASLLEHQRRVRARTLVQSYSETPEFVAGVDVAYTSDGIACGAYVLLETDGGEVVWSITLREPARLPYISGLLTFREMPMLLALVAAAERAGRLAELLFVDGNGLLHPRRTGIATHLGVVTGLPTIGVGKSLLCGKVDLEAVGVDAPRPVLDGDELLAVAMKSTPSSRPVFISPGHRIDIADATRLARLSFRGHRIPEPVHQADRASKRAARGA